MLACLCDSIGRLVEDSYPFDGGKVLLEEGFEHGKEFRELGLVVSPNDIDIPECTMESGYMG